MQQFRLSFTYVYVACKTITFAVFNFQCGSFVNKSLKDSKEKRVVPKRRRTLCDSSGAYRKQLPNWLCRVEAWETPLGVDLVNESMQTEDT